jgi:hypothetical protein
VKVKSKIEYLIYSALRGARDKGLLSFEYEKSLDLTLEGRRIPIHPDFTITCNGRIYYWEHLGMLDREDYSKDWRRRVAGYESDGLLDALITTDDLGGVKHSHVEKVINDIVSGTIATDPQSLMFSKHHYTL